uniref:Uncharacterized protein n=1 Tax=Lotus japonicus TaxID=34305 RepID=I3T7Y2_LOTJA|nr:unknown [Lotus japonicus]
MWVVKAPAFTIRNPFNQTIWLWWLIRVAPVVAAFDDDDVVDG